MKNLLLMLGFSLIMNSLNAQMPGGQRGNGQQMTGRFYGKIVDASNRGIEAVSVALVQDKVDSVTKKKFEFIAGGMLTGNSGDFSIENVPLFGRYKLRITGIGYTPIEQNVAFEMPNRTGSGNDPMSMLGALDKDLGNIVLSIDEKVLSGVTVTANKPLLQLGIDRKIFNVDKNLVSQGGTAVDIMKNVPSVNVDIDGNVTVRNSSPQIFVDGRPTNMTLEQIPADAIESVEIITNPSAKFDASGGTAGILNIVLKKNKRVGYSGNLRANIDSRAKIGIGGDINLRQNKINVFLAGNYNQRKSLSSGTTTRTSFGTFPTRSLQIDDNEAEGVFGFVRAGIDYFIDNRNTLSLSGNLFKGGMDPRNSSDIRIDSLLNGRFETQDRNSNSDNDFRNKGGQISFKHNFPKAGREWTADINYSKGKNQNSSLIQTDYYKQGTTFDKRYIQSQNGSGSNEFMVFQTDYSNPINDKSKFELGARMSMRKINNFTSIFIANKINSTLYNNQDKVYAAYSTYSNRIKNFGYQLGLRAESSENEGVLNNKQTFRKEFPISFFPSVFLSQKLSEHDDLQLNYSRRINRPNFFQLFPFTDYTDSLNISRGNPDLSPEFTNSLELSYSKIFKNRDNFIASVYFKNTNDLITSVLSPQNDTVLNAIVLISTYENANSSYVTGLELTGRNKITKWWDLVSNANFFTSKIDLETQPDPDQFFSYFFKLNNTFRLPKNISIQLSGDYQSKILSAPGGRGSGGGGRGGGFGGGGGMFGGGGSQSAAQGFIRPNFGVDAGVRLEFLKNRTASISLNINDIFRTKKYDAHTESLPFFIQDVERRRDAQVVRLNFNWRFGKMDASLFKRKNNRVETEGMDNNF